MRRSWLVVLLCGSLVMALSMGVRQVSGLFLRPVAVDIGLTREAFGIAVALQNLVWGLTQPVAGLFADRYGARPVVLACGLLYLAGLASAAMAPNAALFAFGLGVLGGLGQSGTAFAVVLAVIGRAAPAERRSVALGLGSTAGSVGMFVLVPMTSALLDVLDWRSAMLILSALVAVTALLAWPLKESGLANDGTAGAPAGIAAATAAGDRDYWLLNLGFAVCGFQLAFIATYLPVILIDHGFDLATGATVLAAIGAFNILGTYLAGVAGGRWLKTRVLAALYLARAAVIALFLLVPLSRPSAIVIGAMIGLVMDGHSAADQWSRRRSLGPAQSRLPVRHRLCRSSDRGLRRRLGRRIGVRPHWLIRSYVGRRDRRRRRGRGLSPAARRNAAAARPRGENPDPVGLIGSTPDRPAPAAHRACP
jgi:predicted MFS family arabinose efflux permease